MSVRTLITTSSPDHFGLQNLSLSNSDAPCGAVMLMHAFLFKILFISGRLNRHREF